MSIMFRTVALSYPAFILVTTMMSAQLVSRPAVVLVLATFGGLAGLTAVSSRGGGQSLAVRAPIRHPFTHKSGARRRKEDL